MAKRSGAGQIGQRVSIPAQHQFGTSEEIANRDQQGHQPSATSFSQISPANTGGLNLAKPGASLKDAKSIMGKC